MRMRRRDLIRGVTLGLAVGGGGVALARAVAARNRVRIIVGWPLDGPMDIAARLIADALTRRLGRAFEVDNQPGDSGNIATRTVARETRDGVVLLLCGPVNTINTTLFDTLDVDLAKDFVPVASIYRVPLVIEVHAGVAARSLPDFIALAKARPGAIRVAYAGKGTPQHLGIELFKRMAAVDLSLIPYPGSAPALADLVDGRVDAMFDPLPSSIGHIRAGHLVPLAVTSPTPSAALPAIPSANRWVPGYEAGSWFGLVAPKGTPAAVVREINAAVRTSLASPALQSDLAKIGGTAFALSAAAFGHFLDAETTKICVHHSHAAVGSPVGGRARARTSQARANRPAARRDVFACAATDTV